MTVTVEEGPGRKLQQYGYGYGYYDYGYNNHRWLYWGIPIIAVGVGVFVFAVVFYMYRRRRALRQNAVQYPPPQQPAPPVYGTPTPGYPDYRPGYQQEYSNYGSYPPPSGPAAYGSEGGYQKAGGVEMGVPAAGYPQRY